MKKKINEGALDLFLTNLFACGEQVEKIKDALENHLGTSPADVSYGDVGDASEVLKRLTTIASFLSDDDDDTPEAITEIVDRETSSYVAEYWEDEKESHQEWMRRHWMQWFGAEYDDEV